MLRVSREGFLRLWLAEYLPGLVLDRHGAWPEPALSAGLRRTRKRWASNERDKFHRLPRFLEETAVWPPAPPRSAWPWPKKIRPFRRSLPAPVLACPRKRRGVKSLAQGKDVGPLPPREPKRRRLTRREARRLRDWRQSGCLLQWAARQPFSWHIFEGL